MRLTVIARRLRSTFDREVLALNVTLSQWSMIGAVGRHPGATQRSLADALEITEVSAGRLVDRLCTDGMLERRDRDGDRRARAVYITDKAEPLLLHLSEVGLAAEARMFEGFSTDELALLDTYLARVHDNIRRI